MDRSATEYDFSFLAVFLALADESKKNITDTEAYIKPYLFTTLLLQFIK